MSKLQKAGQYVAVVEKPEHWIGESSNEAATPFIYLPLTISEGDRKGDTISWYGYLSEAAFDRTIESLVKAFPDWDGALDTLAYNRYSFEGKTCSIVVEGEEYKGKINYKVKWLNNVEGLSGPKPLKSLQDLIANMGSRSKAIAKDVKVGQPHVPRAPKTPTSKQETQHDSGRKFEDDVPF